MSAAAPEYLFVTSAVLVNLENQGVTARAASARLGSIVPTRALTSLGYDARTCSVAGGLEAAAALVREHDPPLRREMVEPPAALPGLLHPSSRNEPAPLEAVEHGVERRDVEPEHAARSLFDQLANLVAVHGAVLHQREDEQLGAPLPDAGLHILGRHMCDQYIC